MNAEPKNSKTVRLNDSLKDESKKDETYKLLGKTFNLYLKNTTSYRGAIYGKTTLSFLINF